MGKFFKIFIELIYWLAIFISPFLVGLAAGIVIYVKNQELLWLAVVVVAIGMFVGIFFAERIRRKYGCSRYMAKIFATPDIWPDEYPEEINGEKEKELKM